MKLRPDLQLFLSLAKHRPNKPKEIAIRTCKLAMPKQVPVLLFSVHSGQNPLGSVVSTFVPKTVLLRDPALRSAQR
eukprot:4396452-Amphidinium_carterae.1